MAVGGHINGLGANPTVHAIERRIQPPIAGDKDDKGDRETSRNAGEPPFQSWQEVHFAGVIDRKSVV